MSFKNALHNASSNVIPLSYLPRWVIRMSKKLKEGDEAANELMVSDEYVLCYFSHVDLITPHD